MAKKTNRTFRGQGLSRRTVVGGAAALFGGMGLLRARASWGATNTAPEVTDMRFGIIALTDNSPIVIAHEKGLFKKYGINSTVDQGRQLGGDPRLAVERRHPGDAHADRHADRVDDGPARLAEEADGDPVDAQPQRPVDHARRPRSRARSRPTRRRCKPLVDGGEGQGHADDVRDDVPARHARDVDALLARRGRHQPRQGRLADRRSRRRRWSRT